MGFGEPGRHYKILFPFDQYTYTIVLVPKPVQNV